MYFVNGKLTNTKKKKIAHYIKLSIYAPVAPVGIQQYNADFTIKCWLRVTSNDFKFETSNYVKGVITGKVKALLL